jgi:ribosomal-protein-alanine N-acetyltransferase
MNQTMQESRRQNNMQIRRATIEDVDAIKLIELSALSQSFGKSFLEEEVQRNPFANYFVIEKEEGKVIGYMGLRIVDDHAEVMNFAVYKSEQNKGYGTQLMEYVLQYVMEQGVRGMSLEVRKSNEVARRMYSKYGFVASRLRPNYYKDEDGIVYFKEFVDDHISY